MCACSPHTGSITLLTAMGDKKTLIMELLDFLSGRPEFQYGKEASETRKIFRGLNIGTLVLICTGKVSKKLPEIENTVRQDYPDITIRAVELDCDDLQCAADDEAMRIKVYEAVEKHAGPHLVISSAGRKTITQRIVEAGLLYGCMGYLSITAPEELSEFLKNDDPEIRKHSERFNVLWIPGRQFVKERRKDLIKDETGDSFRSVYLFPGRTLKNLMDYKIGASPRHASQDLHWLRRLPKADLHCHLGGCQDEKILKKLASALIEDCKINNGEQKKVRSALEQALKVNLEELEPVHLKQFAGGNTAHCLKGLKKLWKTCDIPRHIGTAVLVDALSHGQISRLSRDGRLDEESGRIQWPGLEKDPAVDPLDWYMSCGDLGGSALLQTENTLRLALSDLMNKASEENVTYLEVRCSPDNYTEAGLNARQALEILIDQAGKQSGQAGTSEHMLINFLIMATRHKSLDSIDRHVALALLFSSHGAKGSGVTGFDLAGNESEFMPGRFQEVFMPLHRACINITIHAGEMETEESIWQAIYMLHARRIGHGLKLVRNKRMMNFARDHDLAVEMCPSSNMQTNGFCTYWDDGGSEDLHYPLSDYLEHGIRVTVNTDNRFISDTNLSNEYLMAAKMTKGGLSRWQVLKLVKNGFKSAFLPKNEKDRLLKKMDEKIFCILLDDAFPCSSTQENDHV